MIEEVTRYQTKDGVLHESQEDAERHIVTNLENLIGGVIDRVNRRLSPHQVISSKAALALVDELVGTPDRAISLKQSLNKYVG